jgi:hypothetical protein
MSQLSIKLTAFGYFEFIRAHFPALRLSILILLQSWPLVGFLRGYDFNPASVISITILAAFLSCITLLILNRDYFLGVDGIWFYEIFIKSFKGKLLNPVS